jgi:acetyl esterase
MNDLNAIAPLDPDARQLLWMARKAGYPPFHELTPVQARAAYAASWAATQSPGGEVAAVQDHQIQGPAGTLGVRVYRGSGTGAHDQLPCLVFLHGGGWVIGNLESHDRMCRRLANVAGICVVAVDYRLAPEHPYPAALEDCVAALRWVNAQAQSLGIDARAIGVGGDSAGGNLAAVLALMGREGELPAPVCQALIYPVLDLTASTASYQEVSPDFPLSAQTMAYFIAHYTPQAANRLDWRASPLRASQLEGLPPTLVMTVGHDPLRDEGLAYVRRLEEARVRVTALHCNDQMHGLLSQGRLVRAANVVADQVFAWVGFALHQAAERARSPT